MYSMLCTYCTLPSREYCALFFYFGHQNQNQNLCTTRHSHCMKITNLAILTECPQHHGFSNVFLWRLFTAMSDRDNGIFRSFNVGVMTLYSTTSTAVWKAVWNGRSCSVLHLIKYSPSWANNPRWVGQSIIFITLSASNPVRLWQWFNLDKNYRLRTSKFL